MDGVRGESGLHPGIGTDVVGVVEIDEAVIPNRPIDRQRGEEEEDCGPGFEASD
jgi:hypothetical protein